MKPIILIKDFYASIWNKNILTLHLFMVKLLKFKYFSEEIITREIFVFPIFQQ